MAPDDPEFSDFAVSPIDESAACIKIRDRSCIFVEKVTITGCRAAAMRIHNSHASR